MRILAVSDQIEDTLYTPSVCERLAKLISSWVAATCHTITWNTWRRCSLLHCATFTAIMNPLVEYSSERAPKQRQKAARILTCVA